MVARMAEGFYSLVAVCSRWLGCICHVRLVLQQWERHGLGRQRGRLGVAALWKAQQVCGLPVTAAKHDTKADLCKDSGNINDKVEKDRAWPLVAYPTAVEQ